MIPFAIAFYLFYLWLTVLPLAHNVTLIYKGVLLFNLFFGRMTNRPVTVG